jgi:chorismate synthase
MLRFLTAGESHGKSLTAIIEGIPSNLPINKEYIDFHLKRRQAGYGRGKRMKIESDAVQILSGIRFGKTLGSPISFLIENIDWENWNDLMNIEKAPLDYKKITIPRPGHADLVGTMKYNYNDIRNSIERSSARETATRVAVGSVARKLLEEFGILIGSYVESIGGIYSKIKFLEKLLQNKIPSNFNGENLSTQADKSEVRVIDNEQEKKIINKIKMAKKNGDTLGGTFVVVASGVPTGLGSFMHYDRKIDADIASGILSINAVKGVDIGSGFMSADSFGSQVQDKIISKGSSFSRRTNNAGGIEGGITTGMPIILKAAMKPIATLMSPIQSVNLNTMKKVDARRERSDFVAVPSCSVIAESMLAWFIAKHFMLKFSGDSLEEVKDHYNSFNGKSLNRIKKNFKK